MSVTSQNPVCKQSLKLLGDYWTMMIIDKLSDGPRRFRDLELLVEGVNTATLSTRLKNMQAAELISRDEQSRADVTYSLTDLGVRAIPVLQAINTYSEQVKLLAKR